MNGFYKINSFGTFAQISYISKLSSIAVFEIKTFPWLGFGLGVAAMISAFEAVN